MTDETDTFALEGLHYIFDVIGGSIAKHDELEVIVGLIKHVLDGVAYPVCSTVCWNNNAYLGHGSLFPHDFVLVHLYVRCLCVSFSDNLVDLRE